MKRLTGRSRNGTAVYNTPDGDPVKWENNRHRVLQKLAAYEDLEEQGRLLKLPCVVGTDVWYISERTERQGRKNVTVSFIDNGTVDNIRLGCLMVPQITVCNDENIWTTFDAAEDFGRTVFLTREEAEAALEACSAEEGRAGWKKHYADRFGRKM